MKRYLIGGRNTFILAFIKEWHKKLNLDDTQNDDLIHIDSEKDEELESEMTLETYARNVGYIDRKSVV